MKEKYIPFLLLNPLIKIVNVPYAYYQKILKMSTLNTFLAPLMEPDGRAETNNKGFCRRHFQLLI